MAAGAAHSNCGSQTADRNRSDPFHLRCEPIACLHLRFALAFAFAFAALPLGLWLSQQPASGTMHTTTRTTTGVKITSHLLRRRRRSRRQCRAVSKLATTKLDYLYPRFAYFLDRLDEPQEFKFVVRALSHLAISADELANRTDASVASSKLVNANFRHLSRLRLLPLSIRRLEWLISGAGSVSRDNRKVVTSKWSALIDGEQVAKRSLAESVRLAIKVIAL